MTIKVKQTLTTQELAEAWNISKWTIYSLVKDGKISPIIGLKTKGWRFKLSDLEDLAEQRL
jgi:excisionase family DNA binding protein